MPSLTRAENSLAHPLHLVVSRTVGIGAGSSLLGLHSLHNGPTISYILALQPTHSKNAPCGSEGEGVGALGVDGSEAVGGAGAGGAVAVDEVGASVGGAGGRSSSQQSSQYSLGALYPL